MEENDKFKWIASLAAIATIGAAVTYVLGRLYIESYYKCYFIPAGSITFSLQEYMYFCIPVAMMTVVAAICAWAIYLSFKLHHPFLIKLSDTMSKKISFGMALGIMTLLSIGYFIWAFGNKPPSSFPPFEGLLMGFCSGFIANILMWGMYFYFSWGDTSVISNSDRMAKFQLVYLLIFFCVCLPILATNLAERAALYDYYHFPIMRITSEKLPQELALVAQENNSVNARILLMNNDWIFFSLPKSTMNDQYYKTANLSENNMFYSMRLSDIQHISKGLSENITVLYP